MDACAGPDNPFVSHAFLKRWRQAASATAETGWLPQHILVEDEGGHLVGAAPLYLKSHSYGEYVFDHGWAHALGKCRRKILSEAAGGGALHAGDRATLLAGRVPAWR